MPGPSLRNAAAGMSRVGSGVVLGRHPAEPQVWQALDVVAPPGLEHAVRQRAEEHLVEQLVALSAVEAFDVGVLLGLARRDATAHPRRSSSQPKGGVGGVIGAVVANN